MRPSAGRPILFHGHCHQKASNATAGSIALLQRIPGATVDVLDAGCCGMAGSFGFEREHYDLSLEIGGMRLFPAVEARRPTRSSPRRVCRAASRSCREPSRRGGASGGARFDSVESSSRKPLRHRD